MPIVNGRYQDPIQEGDVTVSPEKLASYQAYRLSLYPSWQTGNFRLIIDPDKYIDCEALYSKDACEITLLTDKDEMRNLVWMLGWLLQQVNTPNWRGNYVQLGSIYAKLEAEYIRMMGGRLDVFQMGSK